MNAEDCATSIGPVIGDLGSRFMLHPETTAAGAADGFPDGFSYYMAGRGGVLGDVDADLVHSAFMFFNPTVVTKFWNRGVAVAGAAAAAASYARACAEWGRKRLSAMDGVERLAELLGRVVSAADSAGMSLFAGWRAVPLPDDAPGRAYQLIHVMRELRGSAHVAAVTAAGLSGLEAVLVGDGGSEALAQMHGWPGESPSGREHLRPQWERAERDTSTLMSGILARALNDDERAELARLVADAAARIDASSETVR